jgi:hypothetical protein
MLVKNKHFSLLGPFVKYEKNSFCATRAMFVILHFLYNMNGPIMLGWKVLPGTNCILLSLFLSYEEMKCSEYDTRPNVIKLFTDIIYKCL